MSEILDENAISVVPTTIVLEPLPEIPDNDSFRLETPANTRIQRRKRTSPRDHATLEAAYHQNSKPDKEERAALVRQTELTEKEVQIWFQNRRQNDRRKAKPLQPYELIPHFRNGVPIEAVKQLPSPQTSQEAPASSVANDATKHGVGELTSALAANVSEVFDHMDGYSSSSPAISQQQTPTTAVALSTPPSSLESSSAIQVRSTGPEVVQVTKKRSHEQMSGHFGQFLAQGEASKQPKPLQRSSSFVRLAVSADGSVKVRVNDETTPSPPKKRPALPAEQINRRSSGLSRTQSNVSMFNFRDAPTPMRGAMGRSRDARTWEFYCDRSARSSLAARAEEEASGSALGAIGLLRSASQKRSQVLSPNPNKQNALRRSQSNAKSKPSLIRAQSSMARLQSSDSIGDEKSSKRPRLGEQHRCSSGADSDKENWVPGAQHLVHDMPGQQPSMQQEAVSHKQSDKPSLHVHPTSNLSQEKPSRPVGGNGKAKGDDLDCIQGLLSLSQGAWR